MLPLRKGLWLFPVVVIAAFITPPQGLASGGRPTGRDGDTLPWLANGGTRRGEDSSPTPLGPTGAVVPRGCNLKNTSEGKTLVCKRVHFKDILETARSLGKDLVSLMASRCPEGVTLDQSCFSNSTNLRLLALDRCPIKGIADGTFTSLTSLSRLSLVASGLRTITAKTFSGLHNLKSLSLDSNWISALPVNAFKMLGNLTTLTLRGSRNRIRELKNCTFVGLVTLEKLVLKAKAIRPGAFRGLPSLSELALSGSTMVDIDEEVFQGLLQLKTLKLDYSFINTISAGAFRGLDGLLELDLSKNNIKTLENNTFEGLPRLRLLNLHNSVQEIRPGAFRGLGALLTLDMGDSKFYKIGDDAFLGLTNLMDLDLYFDGVMFGAKSIQTIGPQAFRGLDNLRRLNLARNDLKTVFGQFRGLNKLESLNIASNKLQGLSSQALEGLGNLQRLDLSNNLFSGGIFGDAFAPLKSLRFLDLSGFNRIFIVFRDPNPTRLFGGLKTLESVNLTNVYLGSLTKSQLLLFNDQADSLRELVISNCGIADVMLPPIIKNLRALQRLVLSGNFLQRIDRSSLPASVEQIEDLDLGNNNIVSIEDDTFKGMRLANSIELGGNDFDCSCARLGFSSWLRSGQGQLVRRREELPCATPKELNGTRVIDYDPDWWRCSQYVPLLALVATICFLFVVVVVVVVIYCNRINIKHWALERRVVRKRSAEEQTEVPDPPVDPNLLNAALCRNSLRQGKTGAFLLYDYREQLELDWVNKYAASELEDHPMKITLQYAAGPEVFPMWKQVKDFSFQVQAFLVLASDEFLKSHWPEMAEKSGIENIQKCVFVLLGKKKGQLPKEMKRMRCPCIEWPESGRRLTTVARERDQFWKELRIALLSISV